MRRLLLAGVSMALLVSALSLGASGTAFATHPATKEVKCTSAVGSLSGTVNLSGCNDRKNTDGSGSAVTSTLTTSSGTITWANGGTTTVDEVSEIPVGTETCKSGWSEYSASGQVSGGTEVDSIPVGWLFSWLLCESSTGKVKLLKGTDFIIFNDSGS
jgi:hypothetical protein